MQGADAPKALEGSKLGQHPRDPPLEVVVLQLETGEEAAVDGDPKPVGDASLAA